MGANLIWLQPDIELPTSKRYQHGVLISDKCIISIWQNNWHGVCWKTFFYNNQIMTDQLKTQKEWIYMATYWYENTLRNYGILVKRSRLSPCLCWLVRTCCAQTVELSVGWCTMTPMWCYYYNNVAKRLTFELPMVWDAIVLISTTEISIDFHICLD